MVRSDAKFHADRLRIKGYCKREFKDHGEMPKPIEVAMALELDDRQTKIDMIEMGLFDD